jgi:hypothetical protein
MQTRRRRTAAETRGSPMSYSGMGFQGLLRTDPLERSRICIASWMSSWARFEALANCMSTTRRFGSAQPRIFFTSESTSITAFGWSEAAGLFQIAQVRCRERAAACLQPIRAARDRGCIVHLQGRSRRHGARRIKRIALRRSTYLLIRSVDVLRWPPTSEVPLPPVHMSP